MDKCKHPNCNETKDVHHYYYIPSRWGAECFWYCKEHKAYGRELEKTETQKLLDIQKQLGSQHQFVEVWTDKSANVDFQKVVEKENIKVQILKEKPLPKIAPNYGTEDFKGVKKKKSIHTNAIPFQPQPITIENFFIRTWGWFSEITEIPEGFTSFFKSKGSEYFTNENQDTVVRVSDHWGYAIRFCNWQLKGYPAIPSQAWHKVNGKGKKIGLIKFDRLEVNNHYSKSVINPERTVKKALELQA